MATTISSRLRRAGGTFVATIPKEVVNREGLRAGEAVLLTLRRREEAWRELRELVKDLKPWDRRKDMGADRY